MLDNDAPLDDHIENQDDLHGQQDEVIENEVTSESSADSQETDEEKSNGVQKRINKITAEKYAIQREKDELAKRIAELESQKPVTQTVSDLKRPSLPDDIYDEEAMRQYHADIIEYTESVAESKATSSYERRQAEAAKAAEQSTQQERINAYAENAIKDGVDIDKLASAEKVLMQAGIKPELGNYLLTDPNGGKIATYLADNPAEMHEILSLDPVSAGIRIATEIKQKALSKTPKVSQAPEPVEVVKGGGVKEVDDFLTKYPTFEIL